MVEPAPYDVLLIGLAALLFATGLRVPSGMGSVLLFAALFVLSSVVSIIVARESITHSFGITTFYACLSAYMFMSGVFVATLVVQSEGDLLDTIWSAWIVAAAISSLLGALAFFNMIPGSDTFMMFGRAKGAFKDPNVFGPFLIPPTLVLLSRLRLPGAGRRLLNLSVFILLVIGIFLSYSRGAWANFLLSLVVFASLHIATLRSLKQYSLAALGAILILGVAVVALMFAQSNPEVREMFETRAALLQAYDVEAGGRFSTQREALEIIVTTPLGVGPNRTKMYFVINPHNVYIKTFLENGWLGGLSFLVLLATVLFQGFRAATREGPFRDIAIVTFASLAGIVGESFIIDTLHWRFLFLLIGMMIGLTILTRHQPRYWQLRSVDSRI